MESAIFADTVSSLPPDAPAVFVQVQANLSPRLLLTNEPTVPPASPLISSNLPTSPNSPKVPIPPKSTSPTQNPISHINTSPPPTTSTIHSPHQQHRSFSMIQTSVPPLAALEIKVQQALHLLTKLSANVESLKINQSFSLDSLKF